MTTKNQVYYLDLSNVSLAAVGSVSNIGAVTSN